MSQEEIEEILIPLYPEYVPFRVIKGQTSINRTTLFRNLRSLIKRDEVQFILKQVETTNGLKWKRFYRIRRD